jgi:hypothetical protein
MIFLIFVIRNTGKFHIGIHRSVGRMDRTDGGKQIHMEGSLDIFGRKEIGWMVR